MLDQTSVESWWKFIFIRENPISLGLNVLKHVGALLCPSVNRQISRDSILFAHEYDAGDPFTNMV